MDWRVEMFTSVGGSGQMGVTVDDSNEMGWCVSNSEDTV